jgi:hypothetical protein
MAKLVDPVEKAVRAASAPPGDHDARDPQACADLLHDEVAGYFENEIAPVERADREAVGASRHSQIATHRQPGEGGVDPVDVAEGVRDEGKREQPQIDLPHRRLFERCVHGCLPWPD